MKISLISATSIIALLSAAVGPAVGSATAAMLNAIPEQSNIYDLVHDGMTSSDGGDRTVSRQNPIVSATLALEAASGGWQTASFTGPVDLAARGKGYPSVPLGAAAGTKRDDDLASAAMPAGNPDAYRKAQAIGRTRIAALIGTVGNRPASNDKSGSTVFVVAGGTPGFNDGGNDMAGARSPSVGYAFAPSSTSTATMTVAGTGSLARPRLGTGFSVAAANSLQVTPVTTGSAVSGFGDAVQAGVLSDTIQPTLGYNYAPAANPGGKSTTIAASFSDAVTANGMVAGVEPAPSAKIQAPQLAGRGDIGTARIQTSQLQPSGTGRSSTGKIETSQLQTGPLPGGQPETTPFQTRPGGKLQPGQLQTGQLQTGQLQTGQLQTGQLQRDQGRFLTSEAAANAQKLLELSQSASSGTQVDGTRTFISASVSANPSVTAARYMANVVNSNPLAPAGQTVEAFQVGPAAGAKTPGGAGTTVAEPLHGKIMASAGALNNSLALP